MYTYETGHKDKGHSKTMILHSHTGFHINVHLYQRHIITNTGSLGNIKLIHASYVYDVDPIEAYINEHPNMVLMLTIYNVKKALLLMLHVYSSILLLKAYIYQRDNCRIFDGKLYGIGLNHNSDRE